jgi:hypothetical protein
MKEAMRSPLCRVAVALALITANSPAWSQTAEARSLEEVRNTVINLLQALVEKGVMTAEQAQAMVAAAQEKATVDAKARAEQDAADSDAVRVTYVPEIVRKQISDQVRADIKEEVTQDVMAQAKADGWGVPGALPGWIKGVRLYGDVRARAQGDVFSSENPANAYLDVNDVNDRGGIGAAEDFALLNTTQDRNRVVGRVRAGLAAQLGKAFSVDVRLASGNQRSPVSTNQTLGDYGGRWELNVDKAAVLWNPVNDHYDREFELRVGRFANPFVSYNDMIWDDDLTFEGLAATYAFDLFGRDAERMERGLFLTLGAFPLQEVELASDDKWLYGGQFGAELPFGGGGSRIRFAAGYFAYDNITGIRNTTLDSNDFDYTAPGFVQRGNTLFDIRLSSDPDGSENLLALAGEYELASANIELDLAFGETHVVIGGEYVKNLAWETQDVLDRTNGVMYILEEVGTPLRERTAGYEVGVMVGRPTLSALGHWRTSLSYRYLERDAVLDAFTDSDFHLGGTDAKGYQLGFDLGLSRGAWLRLRYLSANEIDGPPLGIDVWQLDLNGSF